MIPNPILAYPATVVINDTPVAVLVTTTKTLVPTGKATFKPVTLAVLKAPIANIPDKAGANVAEAAEVNELLGVDEV